MHHQHPAVPAGMAPYTRHDDTAMPHTHMTCHHVNKTTHSVLCMSGETSLTVSAFMHAPDVQAWDDPHSGLLLSERLVNCPPQLAPPLNQALFDELAWAKEDEPTQVPSPIWQCSSWCYTLFLRWFSYCRSCKDMIYTIRSESGKK